MKKTPRVTYLATVKREYDEFAAMLGSEEDIEQPANPNDWQQGGYEDRDEAFRECQVRYSLADADDSGPFRAFVYEVGPRGGLHQHWDLDTRGPAGGWSWTGPHSSR